MNQDAAGRKCRSCAAWIWLLTLLLSAAVAQQTLSPEYLPSTTLTKKKTKDHTVFTLVISHDLSHPDHCSQMEIVVVGLTRQSPNVVIYGPSDIGTILTVTQSDTADTCEITVPGTFMWQQVSVRRSPTATDSYLVTTKVSLPGAVPPPPSHSVIVPLRPFVTAFTQPGAFQSTFKYSPGLNGAADQFSTDVDFSPSWPTKIGWIGIAERYKYDSRPNQNPDALISSLTLQQRSHKCSWYSFPASLTCPDANPAKPPSVTIRPAQLDVRLLSFEYAPGTGYGNVISSGRIGLPFVFTIHHQPSAFTLTPGFGMDAGTNVVGSPIPGIPGFVLRGTPGADASLRVGYERLTKYLDKKPITISARYRAYIPTRDELLTTFSSTSGKPPIFSLSSKTRHFAQADVSIPLTKYVTAGFSYLFGSLPPSFRQFDHNIQISIKAQSQADYEH